MILSKNAELNKIILAVDYMKTLSHFTNPGMAIVHCLLLGVWTSWIVSDSEVFTGRPLQKLDLVSLFCFNSWETIKLNGDWYWS